MRLGLNWTAVTAKGLQCKLCYRQFLLPSQRTKRWSFHKFVLFLPLPNVNPVAVPAENQICCPLKTNLHVRRDWSNSLPWSLFDFQDLAENLRDLPHSNTSWYDLILDQKTRFWTTSDFWKSFFDKFMFYVFITVSYLACNNINSEITMAYCISQDTDQVQSVVIRFQLNKLFMSETSASQCICLGSCM